MQKNLFLQANSMGSTNLLVNMYHTVLSGFLYFYISALFQFSNDLYLIGVNFLFQASFGLS